MSGEDVWKKHGPGGRKNRFKSLEAEVCLVCLKSNNETSMAGVGKWVKEVVWGRPLHGQPREGPELRSDRL